jgi:hypothetical protein
MLFLGVPKHMMAHVDRLFGNKNLNFQKFCEIKPKHIKFSKDISLMNGVPSLILQMLSQYQPLFGNLLNTLLFHACCWFILDY